jgi:hypothetical protein
LLVGILASLWGVAILLPLLHIFTRWLSFADFTLPTWIGWVGVVIRRFYFTNLDWLGRSSDFCVCIMVTLEITR